MPRKKTIIDQFPRLREQLSESEREVAAIVGASAIAWIEASSFLRFAFCKYTQLTPDQLRAARIVLSVIGKADEENANG